MTLRVAGGRARGVPLRAPKGTLVRPTSERVRGALFSILASAGLEGSRVLDLYAGTGALGIEALSRGAGWVDLVERAPGPCRAIQQNLRAAGLEERAKVWCMPVARALNTLRGPYRFILADPPYVLPEVEALLQRLGEGEWLEPQGILVMEHSRRRELAPRYGSLGLWQRRCYGDTCLSLYRGGDHGDGPVPGGL